MNDSNNNILNRKDIHNSDNDQNINLSTQTIPEVNNLNIQESKEVKIDKPHTKNFSR